MSTEATFREEDVFGDDIKIIAQDLDIPYHRTRIPSGSADTWAPSGLVYWNGSLFFAGLRGQALYEAKIVGGNKLELFTHFKNEFGRIRTVSLGKTDFYIF